MDSLQNELKELKSFIADLKADRAAQKEKEKRAMKILAKAFALLNANFPR